MTNAATPAMTLPSRQPFIGSLKNANTSASCAKSVSTPKVRGLRSVRYLMDLWFGAMLRGDVYGASAVWAN